ncbi:MAG: type II toxin-antitoxin system VapC family toxin [Thermoplasmata archaeon]
MKGLDTPVLLALLRGRPAARTLLQSLQGEELATTEWNLFELELLARGHPSSGLVRKRAALEKLRRRLTVIALDQAAVRASLPRTGRASSDLPTAAILTLMLGAMEANGATEWYTSKDWARVRSPGKCRVRAFDEKQPKSR